MYNDHYGPLNESCRKPTFLSIPWDISEKRVKSKEITVEPINNNMSPRDNIPLESSDTSESEEDKNQVSGVVLGPVVCPFKHEGRLVMSEEFPVPVDELFKYIFNNHPMMERVAAQMKYSDMTMTPWEEDPETGLKKRVCRLVVPIVQTLGPKQSQVTDTQTMRCCRPGELYVVEKDSVNAGVPYCDSFSILTHFCMARVSDSESSLTGYTQIIYRKSMWGLIKTFIEKTVYAGFDDYVGVLKKNMLEECSNKQSENGVEAEVVMVKERVVTATAEMVLPCPPTTTNGSNNETALWLVLGALLVLLLLNGLMYYKLLAAQSSARPPSLPPTFQANLFSEERSHEQWVSLVREQAIHHQTEAQRWKSALKSIVSLLKQAEEAIADLQTEVHSSGNDGLVAALKPLSNLNNAKVPHDEI